MTRRRRRAAAVVPAFFFVAALFVAVFGFALEGSFDEARLFGA
jgi:hypothetical protein